MPHGPDKALQRRVQLRDKMAMQIVQEHRRKFPGLPVDQRAQEVVRHQIGILLEEGPVKSSDLTCIARMLKAAAERDPLGSSDGGKYHHGGLRDSQRLAQTAPATPQPQQHQQGSRLGGLKNPYEGLTDGSSDVHVVAQAVRSLPPLVQKRIALRVRQEPWEGRFKADAEQIQRDRMEEHKQKMKLRAEQKEFLDTQVRRREENKIIEKQRALALAREEHNQRDAWHEEAVLSARRRKEETRQLMDDLMQQRREALAKKLIEDRERKLDEAEKVRKLHEEIVSEEEEKRRKKEKVREEIKEYMSYNQEQKVQRQMEKKKLAEMDVKALKEYEAKLELQEIQRQENLKKITERQARQYEMANSLHSSMQALAQQDEQRSLQVQSQIEQRLRREEEERRQKELGAKQHVREIVEAQMREKELAKARAKEEAKRLKEEIARTVQQQEAKELEKKKQARLFAIQGLREIDKQLIELHERRFNPAPIKIGKDC
eukprot:NODE_604_length_2060_cov_30.863252_g558_i0.p1 GENE.NODE_604_length_2060_cov_30.863252_g558_i0~~NODE_604_length_2060_cov_30.863252_g558_i0.p1  ORF type:complete len:488 (+),score=160.01 NODE_604_length_2060_cov_30.863252_g558_i0:179-1642(+)